MRLDYVLYGLAALLFATTAFTFVMVTEQDGQLIYAASTAVLGVLSIGAGYSLKPKTKTEPANLSPIAAPQLVSAEPIPQPEAPIEPTVEVPKPEAPATPAVEDVPPTLETPKAAAVEVAQPAEPAPVAVPVETPQSGTAVPAPVQEAVPVAVSELTQIRGISAKRAEQLKANGVNTLSDLAKASSAELAAKLEVSEKIVKMWIGSAKKQIK